MSQGDASHGSADIDSESPDERADSRGLAGRISTAVSESARSGTLAGLAGAATVLRGVRALRAGDRARALGRLVVGGALLAVAAVQRRAGSDRGERIDIDQSDVVDTGPDVDAVGSEADSGGGPDRASGDEASTVVDTSPDIEGVGGATEGGTGGETEEAGSGETEAAVEYDRLGSAAFDEESNEVPVPQRAFDRGFLALDAEAVWGVRDDDTVVVSQLYDPIDEAADARYVASTQIDEERVLTLPDAVLDHWDDVYGGGVAVEGGDDVVFATTDDLEADSQLLVVPEKLAADVFGGAA